MPFAMLRSRGYVLTVDDLGDVLLWVGVVTPFVVFFGTIAWKGAANGDPHPLARAFGGGCVLWFLVPLGQLLGLVIGAWLVGNREDAGFVGMAVLGSLVGFFVGRWIGRSDSPRIPPR